jgi:hypothetical protein
MENQMTSNIDRFTAALGQGQKQLKDTRGGMEVISDTLTHFGLALNEFGKGLVGVACVVRDGHQPFHGDFLPGVPLSVVIVSHEAPERPMPIVGGILVGEQGFPVDVTVGDRTLTAHDEDSLEAALCELAQSRPFAAAVSELLAEDPRRLQS